jgi:hypothetical protein
MPFFANGKANNKPNIKGSAGAAGQTTAKVKAKLSSTTGGVEYDSNPDSYSSREATPPYTHPSPNCDSARRQRFSRLNFSPFPPPRVQHS